MTSEEIREAIQQVQAEAMALHRRNVDIRACTAFANLPLRLGRSEWLGLLLTGALIGAVIGCALIR